MGRAFARRLLYRFGWDTRSRHRMPVRILRKVLAELPDRSGPLVLDVGSGRAGLAAFMPDIEITGVDLQPPSEDLPNLTFVPGMITDLPFPDGSFPLVACLDVLEYLSVESRNKAIGELVRVASHGLLIACPHGQLARSCDREYEEALVERESSVPEWITEPGPHPYPTATAVAESVRRADGEATVSVSYCEPARVTRLVRAAAARSAMLYAAVNLCFGLLLPLTPEPSRGDGLPHGPFRQDRLNARRAAKRPPTATAAAGPGGEIPRPGSQHARAGRRCARAPRP